MKGASLDGVPGLPAFVQEARGAFLRAETVLDGLRVIVEHLEKNPDDPILRAWAGGALLALSVSLGFPQVPIGGAA